MPSTSIDCELIVQSNKPSTFQFVATCDATVGRKRSDFYSTNVTGIFIRPLLDFSQQKMEFKHVHDYQAEEQFTVHIQSAIPVQPSKSLLQAETQELVITNRSQVRLVMSFDCPSPFAFSESRFELDPGESHTFLVTFDPGFKADFLSEVVTKKLTISFRGHPQKLHVGLRADVIFPNLSFQPSMNIDFGILMMNTERINEIMLRNTTELLVDLFWELQGRDTYSVKIFDIYPIRARIEPFQQDIVRLSFFALSDDRGRSARYSGTAICHVVGGPEYALTLTGGSAAIQYKLEPQEVDFGDCQFKDRLTNSLTLSNHSEVPITFSAKVPKSCQFSHFYVAPADGTVEVGNTAEIALTIVCGLPQSYKEPLFVRIGHYEDVRVHIIVHCFVPQIEIALPRHETDDNVLRYRQKMLKQAAKHQPAIPGRESESQAVPEPMPEELSKLEVEAVVHRLTDKSTSPLYATAKKKPQRCDSEPAAYNGWIYSRYVMDMGRIVFGEPESKDFTFKSITPFPLAFEIESFVLQGTGFSMEPCSFENVPFGEQVSVTVTFSTTSRTNEFLGDVEFEIPIVFADDVAIKLYLRAFLHMPILNLSTSHFDFGNAIVGQSRIITVQLQNMNPVSCEFSLGQAQFVNVLQR
jgi:hydrocephalus-inducing protein